MEIIEVREAATPGVRAAGRILLAATGGGLIVGMASGAVVGVSAADESADIGFIAYGSVAGGLVGLALGVIVGVLTTILTAVRMRLWSQTGPDHARAIFLAPLATALCALLIFGVSLYDQMSGSAATRLAMLSVWLAVPIGLALKVGLAASTWCLVPWLPGLASPQAARRLRAAILLWPLATAAAGVAIWYGLAAAGLLIR